MVTDYRYDDRTVLGFILSAMFWGVVGILIGLLIAKNPATAVEVNHDRMRTGCGRPIQTIAQRTVATGKGAVHNLPDRPPRRTALVELVEEDARTLGTKRLDRRQVHLR